MFTCYIWSAKKIVLRVDCIIIFKMYATTMSSIYGSHFVSRNPDMVYKFYFMAFIDSLFYFMALKFSQHIRIMVKKTIIYRQLFTEDLY